MSVGRLVSSLILVVAASSFSRHIIRKGGSLKMPSCTIIYKILLGDIRLRESRPTVVREFPLSSFCAGSRRVTCV